MFHVTEKKQNFSSRNIAPTPHILLEHLIKYKIIAFTRTTLAVTTKHQNFLEKLQKKIILSTRQDWCTDLEF